MEKAKEILRLSLHMRLNQRDVASGTGYALEMLNTVLVLVKKTCIAAPISLGSIELGLIFHPPENKMGKQEPSFPNIDREIMKKELPCSNCRKPMTQADVILDRIVHSAYAYNISGESMRKTIKNRSLESLDS